MHDLLLCLKIKENVLAKFKVECAVKWPSAVEKNFMVKIRGKNAISFLHNKKCFFRDATGKSITTCYISTFLEDQFSHT